MYSQHIFKRLLNLRSGNIAVECRPNVILWQQGKKLFIAFGLSFVTDKQMELDTRNLVRS